MTQASKAQLGAIHALKSRVGLDDDDYRAFLERETSRRSAKELTSAQAGAVIVKLKALSGEAQGAFKADWTGPYAGIARALWLSGYHLGVFADRRDSALLAFVRRQTGIDHLNWVRDAADGAAVVEALKAWLARQGGVVWPRGKADSPAARKQAVIAAQLRLLGDGPSELAGADLDSVIGRLGRRLRARP